MTMLILPVPAVAAPSAPPLPPRPDTSPDGAAPDTGSDPPRDCCPPCGCDVWPESVGAWLAATPGAVRPAWPAHCVISAIAKARAPNPTSSGTRGRRTAVAVRGGLLLGADPAEG